jgi:hypothetical protein
MKPHSVIDEGKDTTSKMFFLPLLRSMTLHPYATDKGKDSTNKTNATTKTSFSIDKGTTNKISLGHRRDNPICNETSMSHCMMQEHSLKNYSSDTI